MVLVDSSVWIDHFIGRTTAETEWLDRSLGRRALVVGDLILAEVLQGFRAEADFRKARRALRKFPVLSMVGEAVALSSARNYRALRSRGVTVRKTIDCLIATCCILRGVKLLHSDRDFDPFELHLGLRVLHP
jgi:predicted nucleic acid-binding protein